MINFKPYRLCDQMFIASPAIAKCISRCHVALRSCMFCGSHRSAQLGSAGYLCHRTFDAGPKVFRTPNFSRSTLKYAAGMFIEKKHFITNALPVSPDRLRKAIHEHAGEDIRLNSPNMQVLTEFNENPIALIQHLRCSYISTMRYAARLPT